MRLPSALRKATTSSSPTLASLGATPRSGVSGATCCSSTSARRTGSSSRANLYLRLSSPQAARSASGASRLGSKRSRPRKQSWHLRSVLQKQPVERLRMPRLPPPLSDLRRQNARLTRHCVSFGISNRRAVFWSRIQTGWLPPGESSGRKRCSSFGSLETISLWWLAMVPCPRVGKTVNPTFLLEILLRRTVFVWPPSFRQAALGLPRGKRISLIISRNVLAGPDRRCSLPSRGLRNRSCACLQR